MFLHERMSAVAAAVLHVLWAYESLQGDARFVTSQLSVCDPPGIPPSRPFSRVLFAGGALAFSYALAIR